MAGIVLFTEVCHGGFGRYAGTYRIATELRDAGYDVQVIEFFTQWTSQELTKIIDKFVTDFPTPELVTRSNDFHDVILLPHLGASTKEAEINCAVMAAEQISNFLKDGVIVNSVNFPSIKLGRKTEYRMVIINKNEPGMIGKITDEIGYKNINIADMTHKSRDSIGINLIDLEDKPSQELIENIKNIDHVISVRLCSNSVSYTHLTLPTKA